MAMNQARGEYTLPCGRDVEQVWARLDTVDAGLADEHDLDCPHCRDARASLTVLRQLTGELAAEELEPSLDLTSRIMSAVRANARRGDQVPLPTDEPGAAGVSVAAVAAVLRFAADSVEGVRARHCRVVPVIDAEFPAIEVEMTLAMTYHAFADDVVTEVRRRVTAACSARIGVRLARLDVTIEDLYDV